MICLQEVGENWNNGLGDWNSNAAKIICERLDHKYHLHADWAHLGFDRYREGVAILSRFPFRHTEGRYVSATQDVYSIHARKAVLAQVDVPHFGLVNVFSTHLSWWQDGFSPAVRRPRRLGQRRPQRRYRRYHYLRRLQRQGRRRRLRPCHPYLGL